MKPVAIVGVVLIVLGAVILFTGGLGFGSRQSMMRMGDLQVSVEERHGVSQWPPWVGGVAVVGGLLLLGAGVRQRSAG
jgi:drug/metabolite transporter (DMT)-like permease